MVQPDTSPGHLIRLKYASRVDGYVCPCCWMGFTAEFVEERLIRCRVE